MLPGRGLRDCERQAFLSQGAELSRDAFSILTQCGEVEAEVWRSMQREALDEALLQAQPSVPPQLPEQSAPAPIAEIGEHVHKPEDRGPRLQMCADFLDTGHCLRGHN